MGVERSNWSPEPSLCHHVVPPPHAPLYAAAYPGLPGRDDLEAFDALGLARGGRGREGRVALLPSRGTVGIINRSGHGSGLAADQC